jgi:CheY-like chemotaxis protein
MVGKSIVHKNRCGMGETKKETKKSVSSRAGKAISKHILVADDNKAIRNVVAWILEFMGFEVALAANGIEALAVFLENSFDLVLTDLQMPAMDGLSLARHIKERSSSTPVILLTGSDRETVWKKVERSLVDSVIFKPFRLEDLQRTVQAALASNAEGKMHQVKGKIKEIAGKVIMNPDLEAEGKEESRTGKVQEKIGEIKKVVGK